MVVFIVGFSAVQKKRETVKPLSPVVRVRKGYAAILRGKMIW